MTSEPITPQTKSRAGAKPGSNPLARIGLYLLLSLGGLLMVFPFLWMIVTSFQSMQESLQPKPVWFPNRLNPSHWGAARALGAEGGDATWGGLKPSASVTLEFRATGRATLPLEASIPADSHANTNAFVFGADSGPTSDPRQIKVATSSLTDGSHLWRITVTNTANSPQFKAPLHVVLPDGYSFSQATLPPDRSSRNDTGAVYEWTNIAPGVLGYTLENYRDALRAAPFGRYFLNSFINAAVQVLLGLTVVMLAAYAFAKIEFWGRDVLFALLLSSLVIPGEMLLVPNFVTVFKLGWLDSYPGLIVPWLASVFGIFLLRQFFLSLPNELFEAARIDGAGYGTLLTKVALPLAVPGLVTYGIFSFLGSWNALIWPLIITSKQEMRTLQVGLQSFIGEAGSNYGQLMAASILVIAPIIIGFMLAQRQFIAGVARSGLK